MPISNSDFNFTVLFKPDSDRRGGTYEVTDNTDYASFGILLANVNGDIDAFAPDGSQIEVSNLAAPTIIHATSTTGSYTLPLDSNGFVQEQDYSIRLHIRIDPPTDAGDYQTASITHNLCIDCPTTVVSPLVDCLCGKLTVTDDTVVNGFVVVRNWTLTPPVDVPPVHAPIVSTGVSVDTSSEDLFEGTYTAKLTGTLTKGNLQCIVDHNVEIKVSCDFDGCTLFCCYQTLESRLDRARLRANPSLVAEIEQQIIDVAWYDMLVRKATECAQTEKASEYLGKLKTVTNCTEACVCVEGDGPKKIVPICGASGTTFTFLAGNGLTVNIAGSTITYALTTVNVDILANVKNAILGNADGFIDIANIPLPGSPPTDNWTINLDDSAKPVSYMAFRVTIDILAGTAVLSGTPDIRGANFKSPTLFWSPTSAGGAAEFRIEDFYAIAPGSPNWVAQAEIDSAAEQVGSDFRKYAGMHQFVRNVGAVTQSWVFGRGTGTGVGFTASGAALFANWSSITISVTMYELG